MGGVTIDTDAGVASEAFAVILTKRRDRKRFAESCVRVVATQAEALDAANPEHGEYPARVYGPSRSSEGLKLYYLVRWLE